MGTGLLADSQDGRINLPPRRQLVPVGGILLAESLLYLDTTTASDYLGYTLGIYLGTFVYCMLAPLSREGDGTTFVALGLLSAFRIVVFAMPPVFDVELYQLIFSYLPMVPAAMAVTSLSPMPRLRGGLPQGLKFAPVVAPIAIVLGIVEFLILDPSLLVPRVSGYWLLIATLGFVGVLAPVEEVLFRGLLQSSLADRLGTWSAVFVASVLFGAMHAQYGSLLEVGFMVVAGVVFGALYVRFESLALVSGVHGMSNMLVFVILPASAP